MPRRDIDDDALAKTTKLPHGHMYEGSPSQIVLSLAKKIVKVLEDGGIRPDGAHLLGLLHVVTSALHYGRTDWENGETVLGKMPSHELVERYVHRLGQGQSLSDDEGQALNKEFVQIVESLGGQATYKHKVTGETVNSAWDL